MMVAKESKFSSPAAGLLTCTWGTCGKLLSQDPHKVKWDSETTATLRSKSNTVLREFAFYLGGQSAYPWVMTGGE